MERNKERMQEIVSGLWSYNVKYGLDENIVKVVSKNCGSKTLKETCEYFRRLKFYSKEKFWGLTVDGIAFMFGTFAKDHFRLAGIAVLSECQNLGYGKLMLSLLFQECINRGVYKITFRTPKSEKSYIWYQKKRS